MNKQYIEYLSAYSSHLFQNKKPEQKNERKYIGIVLEVHGLNYFAPLSSFKSKHKKMKESIDFIKIKDYAVINLNNMFPVPDGQYTYVDIRGERDIHYRALLQAEYRIIKKQQNKIMKNARLVYQHKIQYKNTTSLSQRCNDFQLLETCCISFIGQEFSLKNSKYLK